MMTHAFKAGHGKVRMGGIPGITFQSVQSFSSMVASEPKMWAVHLCQEAWGMVQVCALCHPPSQARGQSIFTVE